MELKLTPAQTGNRLDLIPAQTGMEL